MLVISTRDNERNRWKRKAKIKKKQKKEKTTKKTKTDRNTGVMQAIVKVWELNDFGVCLS